MTATTITERIRLRSMRNELPSPEECRRIREDAGLSQQDVADVVGATRSAVGLWEQGRRKPRQHALRRYLKALDAMKEAAR